jgi:hypothetical protein
MKNGDLIEALKKIQSEMHMYNLHLEKHMARTALLEAAVAAQEKHHAYTVGQLDARTLRIYNTLDERINKQEAAVNGLPQKALQYISIVGGIAGMLKLLF